SNSSTSAPGLPEVVSSTERAKQVHDSSLPSPLGDKSSPDLRRRDIATRDAWADLLSTASSFSPASPFAPIVGATKSHTPTGNRAPGDTLTYTVVISNTGTTDALGVNFTDTIDPNTTLVAGSVLISPIAVNDTYNTIGNVNISVPAATGLLANDLNPNGP